MKAFGKKKKKRSLNLLHRNAVKRKRQEVFAFLCILWILSLCVWMNHKSILCGFWPQSEVFPPQSKKGLHLWGLGWDFHFLETPSVLFCMVPPGTTALIFLEGMFREPQSPRGKDNGGCDVTSILGASGGKEKNPGWPWWVLDRLSSRNFTV